MPSEKQLHECFADQDWPHQRLNEISDGIRMALPMLPGETRDVVKLLEEKIDVISNQLAYNSPKERHSLNLSHNGLDFSAPHGSEIDPEGYLGIHLALPCGNLICGAKVAHCSDKKDTNQRVGLHLHLDANQSRTLSRYLLKASS